MRFTAVYYAAVKAAMSKYATKIGLEIHARIASKTKIFSDAEMGAITNCTANSRVSYFDAALPGTMPTLNRDCVEAALLTGLALNCKVNSVSYFERKHYYYADLPAGYQITQQNRPIAYDGSVEYPIIVNNQTKDMEFKKCSISRVQIEHDSARTVKLNAKQDLIDLNRAGFGLMEIVTEPNFTGSLDTCSFLEELTRILKAVETCDVDMRDGGFRVDVNVSVHEIDPCTKAVLPSARVELKNVNNISSIRKAIDFEVKRQEHCKDNKEPLKPQTRTFDSISGKTELLREKETFYDYRFMPEPNLPPIYVQSSTNSTSLVENLDFVYERPQQLIDPKSQIDFDKVAERLAQSELPQTVRSELCRKYKLTPYQAFVFVNKNLSKLFMQLIEKNEKISELNETNLKIYLKILLNDYLTILNKNEDMRNVVTFDKLENYIDLYKRNKINHNTGGRILELYLSHENHSKLPIQLMDEHKLHLITDESFIFDTINQVLAKNETYLNDYISKTKKRERIYLRLFDLIQNELNTCIDSKLLEKNLRIILNKRIS